MFFSVCSGKKHTIRSYPRCLSVRAYFFVNIKSKRVLCKSKFRSTSLCMKITEYTIDQNLPRNKWVSSCLQIYIYNYTHILSVNYFICSFTHVSWIISVSEKTVLYRRVCTVDLLTICKCVRKECFFFRTCTNGRLCLQWFNITVRLNKLHEKKTMIPTKATVLMVDWFALGRHWWKGLFWDIFTFLNVFLHHFF